MSDAIHARPGEVFHAELTGAPTGLVGTMGVRILSVEDGATVTARSTAGIVETPAGSGRYVVTRTAPEDRGEYTVFWDSGTVSPTTTATDSLTVSTSAPPIIAPGPTYATPDQVRAYVCVEAAVLLPKDDDDLEPMIEAAELDVDRTLSANLIRIPETGRKLNPAALSAVQVGALSRATCAAVEWRALLGEDTLAEADDGIEAVGNIQYGEPPRPPAPKMLEELAGFGLPWRSGTVGTPPDAEET